MSTVDEIDVWQKTVERLSKKLLGDKSSHIFSPDSFTDSSLAQLEAGDSDARIVVGIAGVPGSGKSTLARQVCHRVNHLYRQNRPNITTDIASDIPMDGFHYTLARLREFPKEDDAINRRGAAFTFDAVGFHQLVQDLVSTPAKVVLAPSFDHAVKDPVEGAIRVSTDSRLILLEGNYCALNRAPWSDAAKLMAELWFIDVPAEVAHRRLANRHLASGIVADEEEAWTRATGTDELNAQDVRLNRLDCSEVIQSI